MVDEDREFSEFLLDNEKVSTETMKECQDAQAAMNDLGIEKPLSEVLVDKKVFTRSEVKQLIREMKGGEEDYIPGYRIEKKLAEGAMGVVYRAVKLDTSQPVALKVLNSSWSRDGRFASRFRKELKITLKLDHENIVKAYDGGKVGKRYYMALELIDGRNLRQMTRDGEVISEDIALDIIEQVASALEYASNQKLVHRDIKPDNIIMRSDGVCKLCDLGLAKTDRDLNLTETGMVVGTPYYISPEQGRGEKKGLDFRSDLYSLGASMYHMTAGRVPFDGEDAIDVLNKHCHSALEPPRQVNPQLSQRFSFLLEKMLAKDQADRHQNAGELLEDVRRMREGEDPVGYLAHRLETSTRLRRARSSGSLPRSTTRKKRAVRRPAGAGSGVTRSTSLLVAATVALAVGGVVFLLVATRRQPTAGRNPARPTTPESTPPAGGGPPRRGREARTLSFFGSESGHWDDWERVKGALTFSDGTAAKLSRGGEIRYPFLYQPPVEIHVQFLRTKALDVWTAVFGFTVCLRGTAGNMRLQVYRGRPARGGREVGHAGLVLDSSSSQMVLHIAVEEKRLTVNVDKKGPFGFGAEGLEWPGRIVIANRSSAALALSVVKIHGVAPP